MGKEIEPLIIDIKVPLLLQRIRKEVVDMVDLILIFIITE